MTFHQAFDFAVGKCSLAQKSRQGYQGAVRFLQLSAEQLCIAHMRILDVKRTHIKLLLEHTKIERKWSNYAYNKNMGYVAKEEGLDYTLQEKLNAVKHPNQFVTGELQPDLSTYDFIFLDSVNG